MCTSLHFCTASLEMGLYIGVCSNCTSPLTKANFQNKYELCIFLFFNAFLEMNVKGLEKM